MAILHVVLNMSHFVIDSRKIFLVVVPSAHFNSEILEKKSEHIEVKIRKEKGIIVIHDIPMIFFIMF